MDGILMKKTHQEEDFHALETDVQYWTPVCKNK
jgi:hypothetical protein